MVLIFGGTTEGRLVTAKMDAVGLTYVYSTKSKINFVPGLGCIYIHGTMNAEDLNAFCRENEIQLIINAAHPFATELHSNISLAGEKSGISIIRFERIFPERIIHPLITYCSNYCEAIQVLLSLNIYRLLAFTGVQSIEKLQSYWKDNVTFFRILPRDESKQIAIQAGFPIENLIFDMPESTIEKECELIQHLNIQGIITKESGTTGFQEIKIHAALNLNIPVVIIKRPNLPDNFINLTTMESLLQQVISF